MNTARPWQRAALWLAFLGPFFFLSYGLAGSWTAQLAHVPSVWFAWEQQIAFLPWTIVPYMSIDAFYAVSLFLCATKVELDTHARRLLAATIISVAGFLLFPLKFAFARPETNGIYGALFDLLTGFDTPYNQAPSLHISLLILLWLVYARHLRGWALWAMHLWFALIGISVFTTFQHHVIDGVGGLVAAIACVYLFPDAPQRDTGQTHRPALGLACAYGAGAVCCLVPPMLWGGWTWLLLWPAASLLLVAGAYLWCGVAMFQKAGAGHSWAARALLLPYTTGAWLSSRWWTRNGPACAQVCPGIWIGRAPGPADWHVAPFAAVLDLAAELPPSGEALGRHYVSIPMLDLVPPSAQQLADAVDALESLRAHGPVLVHCALGYARSALVVSSWLLKHAPAATPQAALSMVREARPKIVIGAGCVQLLTGGTQVHKDNGIDAAVMAAFLRTGRQLDQASMLLLLVAIALAIGARGPALAMLLGLNLAAAGIAKYYALRVALDADLFAVLARHPERIAQWDAALAFCTGRTESARSLAERWAGARRLQQRQIAALTVQLLLLTVCAI